jgi:hypothetical protein
MIVVITAAILGATTLWILSPLLGWSSAGEEEEDAAGSEQEELLEARRQTLASIRDLDMEFRVGKLTEDDYKETRESLAREAVDVLKQLDSSQGREEPPPPPPPPSRNGS